MNSKPLAFPLSVKCMPPSRDDKAGDTDRLVDEIRKQGAGDADVPLQLMRVLPAMLREKEYEVDLVLAAGRDRPRIAGIDRNGVFGIAFDIGTTRLCCSVFDLGTGEKKISLDARNPQVRSGTDVLTRVQKSMLGAYDHLRNDLIRGVNDLIGKACGRAGIGHDDVFALTFAGNTIMSHFLLGLDVVHIPVTPYTPVFNAPLLVEAADTDIKVNAGAAVYVFPNSGSYVGGDIISGLLSAGVHREEEPVLFIDVGTNAEFALGCRDWIMVGAGAAGPALEDGVSAIGRQADSGSISSVAGDRRTGRISFEVIGGGEPQGICGSGMVDLVATLYVTGVLNNAGRFEDGAAGVEEKEGERAFILYRSSASELAVTEREISNFLRSKAAVFAFLSVFTKSVGLGLADLNKIYIAGALGCGINLENAIMIGMLPDLPRERFIPVGNSSLKGAEMLLCDSDLLQEVEKLRRLVTYREMGEDSELLSLLQGGMFIPPTAWEMQ